MYNEAFSILLLRRAFTRLSSTPVSRRAHTWWWKLKSAIKGEYNNDLVVHGTVSVIGSPRTYIEHGSDHTYTRAMLYIFHRKKMRLGQFQGRQIQFSVGNYFPFALSGCMTTQYFAGIHGIGRPHIEIIFDITTNTYPYTARLKSKCYIFQWNIQNAYPQYAFKGSIKKSASICMKCQIKYIQLA